MKRKILTLALATAAIGLSAPSMASTITNLELTGASPFGGFDWSQNGTAVSTPIPTGELQVGDSFTTYYFADAVAISKAGGGSFVTNNMIDGAPGGSFAANEYQYTAVFSVTEKVTSVSDIGDGQTLAKFSATGGSWEIYYDYFDLAEGNTIANQVSGAGFKDGILLLSGNITPGYIGNFTTEVDGDGNVGGDGNFNFQGNVTYTNGDYITPEQEFSNGVATLQFGWKITNWTPPTGTPWGGEILADGLMFQADGNQAFKFEPKELPEPGVLALLGLGMFGLFATTRRKNNLMA